jgi:hypothetical protein
MKIIFTLTCLLLFSLLHAQHTYVNSTPYQFRSFLYQIIKMQDDGNIIIGSYPTACAQGQSCKSYVFASRFNNKGVLLWTKNIYCDISLSNPQGISLRDNGFVLFGTLYDSASQSPKNGVIIRFNSEGNIVWQRQIISQQYDIFNPGLLAIDNDDNLVLMYTVTNSYPTCILQIVKLDKAGNLHWNKTINFHGYIYDFYTVTAFIHDNDKYFIGGLINCQFCEGSLTANILTINANDGMPLACKEIVADTTNRFAYSTSINSLFVNNNTLHILGRYTSEIAGTSYNFILQLNKNSNQEMASMFVSNLFTIQHIFQRYKSLLPYYFDARNYIKKDGTLVSLTNNGTTAYINQYDYSGRICPAYLLPVTDTSITKKTFYTPVRLITVIYDSVYLQNFNVKDSSTSINSEIICSGESMMQQAKSPVELKSSVTILPNPATNILYIEGMPSNQRIQLTVIDYTGNVKVQAVGKGTSYHMNISLLKPGNYWLKLELNGEVITRQFIKE